MKNSIETLPELPVPRVEIMGRIAIHAAIIAALGVVGFLMLLPFIVQELGLIADGAVSAVQIALSCLAIAGGSVVVIRAWPVYNQFIELCANKAVWFLIDYDPMAAMDAWLDEMTNDLTAIENAYAKICGVKEDNERLAEQNEDEAREGDAQAAEALRVHGADSPQFNLASVKPGARWDQAKKIRQSSKSLDVIIETLREIIDATKLQLTKARIDVEQNRQLLSVAQGIGNATDEAGRVLKSRSVRAENAKKAQISVRTRYASSLGKLQELRLAAQDTINSVDLQKGIYRTEALERLRQLGKFINSGTNVPETHEAQLVQHADGIDYYAVPKGHNGPHST